jgi:phosphoglycolate phosphatase
MDLKMPKGVLFDLDGTLLDSAPDFVASLNNLLTKHNKPKLDPEIIRSHVSDGSWKLTSLGFNIDISDDQCAVLRDELLEEYESNLLKYGGAFDGIKQVLASLEKDNIPYGIVTNKPVTFCQTDINE